MQESTDTSATDGDFDAQQLFDDLDTDDDGTLTKDEFLAGKPDDVSDEMAENLWSMMAGSEAESISQDDYLTSMAPPPSATMTMATADESTGSSSGGDSAATSDTESYDPLDTNEDGIVSLAELMAAAPADETPSASSQTSSKGDDATTTVGNGATPFDNRLMAQLMA
nr:EF-hand domain-containing protein [Thalassospira xiamenensis]